MRNSIPCRPVEAVFVSETPTIFSRSIFAKQRTYRGHRNYSASAHTSTNALLEKTRTTEAKFSFAIFSSNFLFFIRSTCLYISRILGSLAWQNQVYANEDDEKAKAR